MVDLTLTLNGGIYGTKLPEVTNLIVFANFCLLTFISSDRNVRSVPLFLKKDHCNSIHA